MSTSNQDQQNQLMASRISKKMETLTNVNGTKCPICWIATHACICNQIKPLDFTLNVEFCTYLHETEWLNAADDAKLLCLAAPNKTTMLVHGRVGDDAKLQQLVGRAKRSCLLFPDDDAVTVAEFLASSTSTSTSSFTSSSTATSSTSSNTQNTHNQGPDLLIIVVDATWRRARRMAKYLERNVIGNVKHIKLETDTVSVYSRTQTETGRICTIEAVALLLQELGEQETVCKALIAAVVINNHALRPKKNGNLYKYGKGMYHPAWYFHTELVNKRELPVDTNSDAINGGSDIKRAKH